MENYLENYKKYNKILYKFLGFDKQGIDFKDFFIHDKTCGGELLRWTLQKIIHCAKDGCKMKVMEQIKSNEVEIYIQEWFDVSRKDGFICIVEIKEKNSLDKEVVSKITYFNESMDMLHRALYNACVDYLIKKS